MNSRKYYCRRIIFISEFMECWDPLKLSVVLDCSFVSVLNCNLVMHRALRKVLQKHTVLRKMPCCANSRRVDSNLQQHLANRENGNVRTFRASLMQK